MFELAVNEAITNVIEHAYGGNAENYIHIKSELLNDRIIMNLYDWGISFDPETISPPTLDGSKENGYGVYMISKAIDDVRYNRDESGKNHTILTMKFL